MGEYWSGRQRGGTDSLRAARSMQRLVVDMRDEFDNAILRCLNDGWSLRALADELGISYSNIRRYAARASEYDMSTGEVGRQQHQRGAVQPGARSK